MDNKLKIKQLLFIKIIAKTNEYTAYCRLSDFTETVSVYFRLGVLSSDGSCKSFDDRANGYTRSEAIATCFIQKAKDSRR